MSDAQILWDLEDDPEGNVQHIAANGATILTVILLGISQIIAYALAAVRLGPRL